MNRRVIALWVSVLTQLPAAELLIAGVPAGETGQRLRAQFAAQGVNPARLHLLGKVNFDDYWQLYHRIDIGLDAFPYNGATTTCESLWMGVPVVTMAGQYAAARSGASLLTSAGLADLVAENAEEFVTIAATLARDTRRLAGLRSGLRDRMKRSPLMDELGFTRAFENVLLGGFRSVLAKDRG